MDLTVISYIAYLLISIGLTVWVAQTLSKAGKIFLIDVFKGNAELSSSVNHLLVVGFYLLNLGFVALFMKMTDQVNGQRQVFEAVALKVGTVLLVLGVLHLFNLYVLNKFRRRSAMDGQKFPPVPPQMMTRIAPPQQQFRPPMAPPAAPQM
ncbi:hypothetical protein Lfu02_29330 [Longispora fulva]|uniref:Putative membrane protein n=1 Tax=Longispora fulva TaxID=619741 RepID=A0A8J7GED1_9ACTN|nr:hypothetical protein [Longispora fulva]MBG6139068.1 putative membrane protein [Longispora fulva]GIG58561.1 hypothetical protein Lfu02_29330 [Longispora fulva]